jgi:hypothetical protein
LLGDMLFSKGRGRGQTTDWNHKTKESEIIRRLDLAVRCSGLVLQAEAEGGRSHAMSPNLVIMLIDTNKDA